MTQPLKIIVCAYRDWGLRIAESLPQDLATYTILRSKEEYDTHFKDYNNDADIILFFGWSWIIPDTIVNNNLCIGLHPSPLPKYRGGSPIQNQIIAGESVSAISLFRLSNKLDKGDILYQEPFSLEGNLSDVFDRIVVSAIKACEHLLRIFADTRLLVALSQDETQGSYYKRRTPEQSEIKLEDFTTFTATELHNKIRALQDPYPNAFVVCKDGTKLYLKLSAIN